MEPVAGAAFPAGRTGIRVRADIGGVLRQSPAVLPSQARDHSLHVPAYAGPARHANRSEIRRAPAPAHPVARHTSAHKMMSDEPHKCRELLHGSWTGDPIGSFWRGTGSSGQESQEVFS